MSFLNQQQLPIYATGLKNFKLTKATTHNMGGGFQWVGQNITHTHTHAIH